jgi:predicted metalloprotease with PDZ domain
MVEFQISVARAHAHCFDIQLTLRRAALPLTVGLPVWIPGSYLVRDFARHLQGLRAQVLGARNRVQALSVQALDTSMWRIDHAPAAQHTKRDDHVTVQLSYTVYGFDPSVRAAFLDAQRAFFNGTSLLLRVHGHDQQPHRIKLVDVPRDWQVATAMQPAAQTPATARMAAKRTTFEAATYDEAIDHPFELGAFWQGSFVARGVTHVFVVSGAWPGFDGQRLLRDTQRVCETVIDFWHGRDGAPARKKDVPFERYVFMLQAVEDGYGGLEHRASTALIASRRDLPRHDSGAQPGEGYTTLLGLISHEYFHTWNVKRLRPVEHTTLQLHQAQPTTLLWFFEGFTSYYDDLLLRRAGLIDEATYLKLVAKTLNTVLDTPGRHQQSVAQASFDAWIKYYRPDENSVNATVSYYTKGALVALALDLSLRCQGRAGATLDGVMRRLWALGDADSSTTPNSGGPISESDVMRCVAQEAGPAAAQAIQSQLVAWIHGCKDAPWLDLLHSTGVDVQRGRLQGTGGGPTAKVPLAQAWGLRISEGPVSGITIKAVLSDSAAERAGLAVGDEILAVNGWRVRRLDEAQAWWDGTQAAVTVSRQQRLHTVALTGPFAAPSSIKLAPAPNVKGAASRQRQRWLGAP